MTEVFETSVVVNDHNCLLKASQILSVETGLSQSVIKDAMQKGAVWLNRNKGRKRLRRATKTLSIGDILELNYNHSLLSQTVPEPSLVHDSGDFSIWFKPFGLFCQGSRWGDFASIDRWVSLNLPIMTNKKERPVFLVHRLDRATSGLILLCHSKTAAREFSAMFREGRIDKRYQAIVHGDFSKLPENYVCEKELDGKPATSIFSFSDRSFSDCEEGKSLIDIRLLTGRKHQIRKHLSSLGFPIVGDRLYGQGDLDSVDLQLQSVSLSFTCPISQQSRRFRVDDELLLHL